MDRVCWDCGRTAAEDRRARCVCGEPLWYPMAERAESLAATWPPAPTSMWAFDALLPVSAPPGLGRVAGGTPLVRATRLDEEVGARVHVKVEGANPTGSFKDRGTAAGVAAALDAGDRAVGTVSHGNMAASVAAHAASVDRPGYVLVPADIPAERLGPIAQYDATLVRVEGEYGRLYEESLAVGPDHGIKFLNSDDPHRVAGQATTVLEACADLARRGHDAAEGPEGRRESAGPDAVVLPVSSGGHASGAWLAVRTLVESGVLETPPRLYLVQAAACAPIAEAFERGDDAVTPVEGGETVAYSIANADPPSGNRALAAARATGGGVVAVEDDAILSARERLATRAGLAVEPASATTLAAATGPLVGELGPDEDVVLVATGRGFATDEPATDPVDATATVDELAEVLK